MDRKKEILRRIVEIMVKTEDVDPKDAEQITENTCITEIMDSLDAFALEMELEKHFGVVIILDDKARTFGDWVDVIEARTKLL
ncbi:MAG: hypothetical protein IJS88_02150 [Alphaproteobacteria bacterium]|nr:hypothetical protein [Alphaproteobacteria bacterium]